MFPCPHSLRCWCLNRSLICPWISSSTHSLRGAAAQRVETRAREHRLLVIAFLGLRTAPIQPDGSDCCLISMSCAPLLCVPCLCLFRGRGSLISPFSSSSSLWTFLDFDFRLRLPASLFSSFFFSAATPLASSPQGLKPSPLARRASSSSSSGRLPLFLNRSSS